MHMRSIYAFFLQKIDGHAAEVIIADFGNETYIRAEPASGYSLPKTFASGGNSKCFAQDCFACFGNIRRFGAKFYRKASYYCYHN